MFVYWLIFDCMFLPLTLLFPIKVINRKNRIKKGKVIYAPNHQSSLDAFYMIKATVRHETFICKEEMAKNFIVRWFLKSVGVIFVNREKPSRSFYKEVNGVLEKNRALTIFPEGTRHDNVAGDDLELKNGIAMFALKNNCPIVPVAIINKPKVFRKCIVVYGKPFTLDKAERIYKETLAAAAKIINDKMKEVAAEYYEEQKKKEELKLAKKNKK